MSNVGGKITLNVSVGNIGELETLLDKAKIQTQELRETLNKITKFELEVIVENRKL